VRAKHFLIHENGQVKLSGLRSVVSMMKDGSRMKVHWLLLMLYHLHCFHSPCMAISHTR